MAFTAYRREVELPERLLSKRYGKDRCVIGRKIHLKTIKSIYASVNLKLQFSQILI